MARAPSEGGGLWHRLGCQLAHPEGPWGTLAGRVMARINATPYRHAIAALAPYPDDQVLEIGFGPGAGLAELARRVTRGHVCGLEASDAMLRLARRRNGAALAARRMTLAMGDFRRLPWADRSFDRVLGVNVAYFFDPDGDAVGEIARVLRPGGWLVLYVTDRATMVRWPFAGPRTHVTYDAEALRRILERGGFAPEAIDIRSSRLPLGVKGLVATARALSVRTGSHHPL
ncbi:class I SAM-dependent methyltransferase [Xanthobacter agilis]|uniref:Ubiquinone/menaquinone biosynthesis C-methylase UbiE n=1 Tax=Xanthobacter agilis TaxID=47492 RepID=A0ABU0LE05_XANAG|nr:methyltransferase domain-containing protein [Xanthobacter agilis]MDQ0505337.1 ubiquinone/menaquinone biosynthesis C-methylase UbiE [Xanthobacter agilis]